MATAAEQLSVIRTSLDPSGYQAGAKAVTQANQQMVQSGEKVVQGQQYTERALQANEKQIEKTRLRYDALYKAQSDLAKVTDTYNRAIERGSQNHGALVPIIENLRTRVSGLAGANVQATNAFGVTANQARQLAPQINDVATSLLGGASAFQVLTQQGGQITQAMGGVGNTFRALATIFTPTRVAVAAVTGAVVASVAAFEAQQSRVEANRRALMGYQTDWMRIGADIDARARAQSLNLPTMTRAETATAFRGVAQVLPPEALGDLERATKLIEDLSRSFSGSVPEALRLYTRAWTDASSVVREMAERNIPAFNVNLQRQVELAEAAGNRSEAARLTIDALGISFGGAASRMSDAERTASSLRKAWENVYDAVATRLEGAGRNLINWLGDVERGAQRAGAALDIMGLAIQGGASMATGMMGSRNNLGGLLTDLLMQRLNGGSAAGPTAGAGANTVRLQVQIASPDLPPEARALLNTIAGPESGGRYDVRWGGMRGPQTIDDLSRHPNILEPGPAGPSSAAGRYQITGSNWYGTGGRAGLAERYGATDFSPQTQDRVTWSWAQDTYRQQTGRDLLEDLRNPSQHGTIAGVLGGSSMWSTLNMGRYAANLAAQGGSSAPTVAASPAAQGATSGAAYSPAATPARSEQSDADERRLREAGASRMEREAQINARISAYEGQRNRITDRASAEGRDLTSDEAQNVERITQAIEAQIVARNQLETSQERSLRTGRENLDVLRAEPGAQREVAQALQQAREQARSEGRPLGAAEAQEVERQALERLRIEREQGNAETRRATASETAIAAAYLQSAAAGREAEARARAMDAARRSAVPGSAEFNRIVEEGTRLQLEANRAQAEAQLARSLPAQVSALDIMREENRLVGENTEVRERRLATFRAEQQVRLTGGDPNSGAGLATVNVARGNIAEQQAQRWNQEAENYGRQMGTAVSKYLYQGIVEGNWRGIKNLEQSLMQIAWQGLIAKPLETALSGMMGSVMGGSGTSPGLLQQIGTGAAGALSSAGNSVWGWLSSLWSPAAVAHTGGAIGDIGPSRWVPAHAIANAPRFHSGRGPGASLAPREILSVLTDDEVVLNRRQQMRAASRLGGGTTVVNNNFNVKDAPSLIRSRSQVVRQVGGVLGRLSRER